MEVCRLNPLLVMTSLRWWTISVLLVCKVPLIERYFGDFNKVCFLKNSFFYQQQTFLRCYFLPKHPLNIFPGKMSKYIIKKARGGGGEGESSSRALPESDIRAAFEKCDESGAGQIPISKLKIVMRACGFEPRQNEIDALMDKLAQSKDDNRGKPHFTLLNCAL